MKHRASKTAIALCCLLASCPLAAREEVRIVILDVTWTREGGFNAGRGHGTVEALTDDRTPQPFDFTAHCAGHRFPASRYRGSYAGYWKLPTKLMLLKRVGRNKVVECELTVALRPKTL